MSDHNELVKRLRALLLAAQQAAPTIEALVGEVGKYRADYEAMKSHNVELFGKLSAAEAEVERLKGALRVIASDPTHSGQAMIARSALEAKP